MKVHGTLSLLSRRSNAILPYIIEKISLLKNSEQNLKTHIVMKFSNF